MSTAFTYQPLQTEIQEIRVLDLGPLPRQDLSPDESEPRALALQCSLRHVSLVAEPKPMYETVSYCWGDTGLSHSIEVNGYTLRVPSSALEVLMRLALPEQPRTLWIDAVCIDQMNKDERSQQVAQMLYIYRYGARNIIYLGGDHPLTERALKNLAALYREIISEHLPEGESIWSSVASQWKSPRPLKTKIDTQALLSLYSCSWFTRVWVFQEAILAVENMAVRGSTELKIGMLLEVAVALWHTLNESLPSALCVPEFYNSFNLWICQYSYRKSAGNGIRLDGLLRSITRLSCSDPRDRVFGVLGITATTSSLETAQLAEHLLKPDYNKALPDVLRDATRFCVVQDSSLSVLGNVRPGDHFGEGNDKRASWALTEESFDHRFYQTWAPPLRDTRAGKTHSILSEANVPDRCHNLDKLHVYGFNIGVIAECSTVLAWSSSNNTGPPGAPWSTLNDFFRTSLNICDRAGNTTPDLARAMTANSGVFDKP